MLWNQQQEQTRTDLVEQHARELHGMSTVHVNDNSNKMLMQTRSLQLKRIFTALGGDGKGYISRGIGTLRINVGDPLISAAIARILLKQFNSSTRKLSMEVFERLCMDEFKAPLPDGFSVWHRLTKHQQTCELADFKESCGTEIIVEPSDTEDEAKIESPSISSPVKRESIECKRTRKTHHEKNVFARLCERNMEKEKNA